MGKKRFVVIENEGSGFSNALQEIVDTQTGVHYLTWQSGHAGGITPLLGADGKPVGYAFEVCRKVAESAQKELGLSKLDVKYQAVTSANRIPLIQNGTVDIECGSTTNSLVRQREAAFSVSYFGIQVSAAVWKNSGINSMKDLNGKTIAVTSGTTSVALMKKFEKENGIRVRYMHADVETIERMELIRGLRLGEFDVLVGINLLREGLDIPEVSMVAILDADKEGFLRSETSLIQTIGRAARNADGLVVLYADTVTPSMRRAMDETERRRQIQDDYNKAHGIIPQTIRKDVREIIEISKKDEESARRRGKRKLSERERDEEIRKLEKQMQEASRMLEFEYAAILRDRIIELRKENTK